MSVTAIDQFGDTDLANCADCAVSVSSRDQMIAEARKMEKMPWMYTGALENDPEVVEQISERHDLQGNGAEVLRAVRDPWRLAAVLRSEAFSYPTIIPAGERLPLGHWLCKPLRSAGGRLIQAVHRTEPGVPPIAAPSEPWYWQQYIPGRYVSFVFAASHRQCSLLGVTRQLVGIDWCGGRRFQYTGSIGPLEFPEERLAEFRRLGDVLAARFALRGNFGVDAVDDGTKVWVVEVNPRWTSGTEIIERFLGVSLVSVHLSACRDEPFHLPETSAAESYYGKAILYARRPLWATEELHEYVDRLNGDSPWPQIADVPAVGSQIELGHPALTVFSCGTSSKDVMGALEQRILRVESLMARPTTP